jgi:outer membrane protein
MMVRAGWGLAVLLAGTALCGGVRGQAIDQAPLPSPPSFGQPVPPLVPATVGLPATGQIRTLTEALSAAYSYNPTLTSARAGLRATDEGVPTALAGWRPTIVVSGTGGTVSDKIDIKATQFGETTTTRSADGRMEGLASVTVTQPIYRGGRTKTATSEAINKVLTTRAQLIATEEQVFSDTVTAYVNVISDAQVLDLDRNNELVLTKQLQATNERFRVGEVTQTDVAQAEAALAQATATRETAEGTLQTARATFQQEVGELPGKLIEPQPLKLPTRTEDEARTMAASNNPNVVAARFNVAAAKDAFDNAYSQIMPTLSLQGSAYHYENQQQGNDVTAGGSLLAMLTVPLYQGGAEYAAIRQARQSWQQAADQIDTQRRQAVQQAITAWETYVSSKATIVSNRAAIRANEIALVGVEQEALVGTQTTLDVLNAEQALLQSRVTLVQTLASYVNASYSVAMAVGRLTARDLNLPVPLYDETAYYKAVHYRWIGTGDFATSQPGR